jgi:hypothetical protein
MKLLLTIAAFLTVAMLVTAAQSPAVTFVTAPNLTVSGARRTGPGQVEVHETEVVAGLRRSCRLWTTTVASSARVFQEATI